MKHKEQLAYECGYRVTECGKVVNPRGKELKGTLNDRGYPMFHPTHRGTSIPVHKLAAYQKFGSAMYKPGIQVRHKVNEPGNASPSNLLLGTQSQNEMDKSLETRVRVAKIATQSRLKLTDSEAIQMRVDHDNGDSYRVLMKRYGVTKTAVSYNINRKTYK